MQPRTKVASFSGLAVLAIGTVVTALSLAAPAPVSAAEAQLKKTKDVVQELSPAETATLRQRYEAHLMEQLDKGKLAKDVRFISAEQFQETTGLDPVIKIPGQRIKSFVAFTASTGEQLIIAIGQDDRPVMMVGDGGKGWPAFRQTANGDTDTSAAKSIENMKPAEGFR